MSTATLTFWTRVERPAQCHPAGQCPLGGALDHRTVGKRIGERHADLEHVGAGLGDRDDDRRGGVGVGVTGSQIGDEPAALLLLEPFEGLLEARHHTSFPARSAFCTLSTSLSPRPERFTSSTWSRLIVGASWQA